MGLLKSLFGHMSIVSSASGAFLVVVVVDRLSLRLVRDCCSCFEYIPYRYFCSTVPVWWYMQLCHFVYSCCRNCSAVTGTCCSSKPCLPPSSSNSCTDSHDAKATHFIGIWAHTKYKISMRYFVFAICVLASLAPALCDIYMHNPRGSNNRCPEISFF